MLRQEITLFVFGVNRPQPINSQWRMKTMTFSWSVVFQKVAMSNQTKQLFIISEILS